MIEKHMAINPDYEKALVLINDKSYEEALSLLKKALEEEPGNPWYLSYYGLCLGHLKKFQEAEKYCQKAIEIQIFKAQFYVNLGEIYLLGGKKRLAHQMFSEALKWDKANAHARKHLKGMGVRRKPVIPLLSRGHPVNVALGKMRHKMFGDSKK